jgi:hypothetical protein
MGRWGIGGGLRGGPRVSTCSALTTDLTCCCLSSAKLSAVISFPLRPTSEEEEEEGGTTTDGTPWADGVEGEPLEGGEFL